MKKILIIVGSLRKNSFNMQLAIKVKEMLSGRADVSFLDYASVPFMNQDIEYPAPDAVAEARNAVAEAHGIWIFTPEYNYQIPGVLKNLLDWLSRPVVQGDRSRSSAIKGKAVTISGVAGRSGAAGARKNLSALMQTMSVNLVGGIGIGVVLDGQAFRTDVLSPSEADIQRLAAQAEEFMASIGI